MAILSELHIAQLSRRLV